MKTSLHCLLSLVLVRKNTLTTTCVNYPRLIRERDLLDECLISFNLFLSPSDVTWEDGNGDAAPHSDTCTWGQSVTPPVYQLMYGLLTLDEKEKKKRRQVSVAFQVVYCYVTPHRHRHTHIPSCAHRYTHSLCRPEENDACSLK